MNGIADLLPLRDIHLPPAIGWWPPPPGWWLAPLLAVALVFAAVWLYRRRRRRGAIQRIALSELAALERDTDLSASLKAQRLSILLRRVALSVHPRTEVAPLQGRAWLQWLDRALGDSGFTDGPGRALVDAPYRPDIGSTDLDALFALCRDWLTKIETRR